MKSVDDITYDNSNQLVVMMELMKMMKIMMKIMMTIVTTI